MDLLERKISIQRNTWADNTSITTIGKTLEDIKTTKFQKVTEYLREIFISNPEKYSAEKKQLSAATFSASFNGSRKIENLENYNHLIVIDIDKLDGDNIESVYNKLKFDKHVYSFWMSPSGKGFKGIVPINFNFEIEGYSLPSIHKHAFSTLNKYFIENHNIELDISGSDIPRLCFISHDPNLLIKEEAYEFKIDNYVEFNSKIKKLDKVITNFKSQKNIPNIAGKNNSFNRKEINSIIRFLEKNKKSITEDYYNWYRVAMAIANSFNFDIGIKVFVSLSKQDKAKFNLENCESFLKECYKSTKNQINFNTIRFLAEKEGYKSKKLGEESREVLS